MIYKKDFLYLQTSSVMKKSKLCILLVIPCFVIISQVQSQSIKCGVPAIVFKVASRPGKKVAIATDADSLYTLPVVVHVIHTGGDIGSENNPSDDRIIAMIDNLNKAWRKNGDAYGGVDMKIQFALATKSPTCDVTTGINRVDGSALTNYSSGGITNYNNPSSANETKVKALSRWPNTDYINIWIVNKINGDAFYPGGYAYFPEFNSAAIDGMVLQASVVDDTNKTIVHEMGHVFSLYHTYADGGNETTCASDTDCAAQGDLICDTEPVLFTTSCTATTNSCTGTPFVVVDSSQNYTVLNNYMGATDCQWMFTAQQKVRVRNALFNFRNGLVSSDGLGAPTTTIPTAACLPVATSGLSPYYGVQKVEFNTLNVYSNTSAADGDHYIDRTCNQSTKVFKGQTYQLTITGSYLNPHIIKAFIDFNNNGDFDDVGETLYSGNTDIATTPVLIPLTGVMTNVPLRLRIVADNPALPSPSACKLFGGEADGGGQIEDYAVIILPREVLSITSGDWNIPSTWSCNCLPQNDDQVIINSTHTVSVANATNTYDLTLKSGASLAITGNNILNVGSTLINNGNIEGTGIININGNKAQTIIGTGRISNLTINNSLGVTITNGAGNMQTINNLLTVTNGLLNTNGNIVLESTATNTARVSPVTESIPGNVTVERYIPSSGYRDKTKNSGH